MNTAQEITALMLGKSRASKEHQHLFTLAIEKLDAISLEIDSRKRERLLFRGLEYYFKFFANRESNPTEETNFIFSAIIVVFTLIATKSFLENSSKTFQSQWIASLSENSWDMSNASLN